MSDRRYISCADTAKLVREALKKAFPGVKFSVRSSTYSGGASIRVKWTDGPETKKVECVAGAFAGADFDGMIDLKSYHESDLNGERVHFGADYVFCDRNYSPGTERVMKERVCKRFGLDPAIIGTPAWDSTRIGDDWLSSWLWRETSGYYDNEEATS
jgi:hypothetical protein